MELKLFTKLQTSSKRAFKRTVGNFGIPYRYSPRADLLDRLAKEAKMSKEEVYNQLIKEREFVLKYFK